MFTYTLMHQNIQVLKMSMSNSVIQRKIKVLEPLHLPEGVCLRGKIDRRALQEWLDSRSVPEHRYELKATLKNLKATTIKTLLTKSLRLSLSDQYWVQPDDKDLSWDKINFFDNFFSERVGKVLSREISEVVEDYDVEVPGITTDAFLPKRWETEHDKTYLLKGVYSGQEPYNEVIATRLMEKLNVPHVPYTVEHRCGRVYSRCPNMLNKNTDLVPMYWLIHQKKPAYMNDYQLCVKRCADVGVDIMPFLNRLIVVDFLMANEDRHWKNFGLLRDAKTMNYIGPAPIFDTGTSLGCLWDIPNITLAGAIACKPFKERHSEQIKLVKDFSWIDFNALDGFEDIIYWNLHPFTHEARISAVIQLWKQQLSNLKHYAAIASKTF